jgi:hypothetical protein
VQTRIFGPKREEVRGEWRKLYDRELHNLYLSADIIRQIKSRRMKWAGHVARMGERKVFRVWCESPKERDHLEDRGSWRGELGVWSGFTWLRIGIIGGLL